MLNNRKDILGKFDAKANEKIFLGYSTSSKAFKFFNKRPLMIEASVQVTFNESNPKSIEVEVVDYVGILEKMSPEDKK